jgi:hypothetical protein
LKNTNKKEAPFPSAPFFWKEKTVVSNVFTLIFEPCSSKLLCNYFIGIGPYGPVPKYGIVDVPPDFAPIITIIVNNAIKPTIARPAHNLSSLNTSCQ